MDPRRGKIGVDLFYKYVTSGHVTGLKLYPPCGFEMDDCRLFPLYEICGKHNLPVLSHTGPSLSILRTERAFPGSIVKIADDFKKTNFILGHGAAYNWQENMELVSKKRNVFYEVSTFQSFQANTEILKYQFSTMINKTPEKIFFGSDWPMFTMSTTLKQIVESIDQLGVLNSSQRENFFYRNVSQILLN